MRLISCKRHRFPPDVIRHAAWLYFRFTLSIRDVEELLAQRGVEVSREAVRCRVNKFRPLIAANLRRRRGPPTGRWHLDEMVVKIAGRRMYFRRAVDPRTSWIHTGPRPRSSALPAVIGQAGCAKTTASKTPTWSSDDENESSRSSSHKARPNGSSRATTRSTPSPI